MAQAVNTCACGVAITIANRVRTSKLCRQCLVRRVKVANAKRAGTPAERAARAQACRRQWEAVNRERIRQQQRERYRRQRQQESGGDA